MSQGKYFGRMKGYSLINLKKSRPMAQDIMALIQKTYKAKRKSYQCLLRPTYSLKYVVYSPSNNNKMSKTVVA
jgi:hypothetical protein